MSLSSVSGGFTRLSTIPFKGGGVFALFESSGSRVLRGSCLFFFRLLLLHLDKSRA